VTDARVESVHEDRITAREFLAQAETLLADAGTRRLSTPAQSLLAHQASVCACDAILQAAGLRVTPGDVAEVAARAAGARPGAIRADSRRTDVTVSTAIEAFRDGPARAQGAPHAGGLTTSHSFGSTSGIP